MGIGPRFLTSKCPFPDVNTLKSVVDRPQPTAKHPHSHSPTTLPPVEGGERIEKAKARKLVGQNKGTLISDRMRKKK